MKKVLSKSVWGAALVIALAVASCAKDSSEGSADLGTGMVSTELQSDATVNVSTALTRANGELANVPGLVAPAASAFDLLLYKSGNLPSSGKRYSVFSAYDPATRHPVGSYVAVAACGDVEQEGFDKPAFVATENFTVVKDETALVQMTAYLANMAITADYTDAFKNYFTDYSVKVVRNAAAVVTFAKGDPNTKVAYVKPEAFTLRVDFTFQSNGQDAPRQDSREYEITENIAPRTLQEVRLDVNNGAVGGKDFVITWNDEPLETIDLEPIEMAR